MSKQIEFDVCQKKANQAVDLAITELVGTRGGEIVSSDSEWRFIHSLSQETSAKRLKAKIKEYLSKIDQDGYSFKVENREQRIGKVRPVDLVIVGHFSSETLERFIVVDLKGEITDKDGASSYARFEAWCRLCYVPDIQQWHAHYVDMIIRHKSPAERALFTFEHSKSGKLVRAIKKDPDELCLFFEHGPQGGMWG